MRKILLVLVVLIILLFLCKLFVYFRNRPYFEEDLDRG